MQAYLFVHFRERKTPDGEQVYFGLSRDGFRWEMVNNGQPVLWSHLGEKGVRDCTIIHCEKDGKYRIFATDLSLAYNFRNKYHFDWPTVSHNGSKSLAMWESEDLVNWSEQRLLPLGDEDFGCLWAPDVFYDPEMEDYVLHWSSSHASNDFGNMGIWFSRTRDFKSFGVPKLLYQKDDAGIIDSAIYVENGKYFMFLKSDHHPERIILMQADHAEGPYIRNEEFDRSMLAIEAGLYEGMKALRRFVWRTADGVCSWTITAFPEWGRDMSPLWVTLWKAGALSVRTSSFLSLMVISTEPSFPSPSKNTNEFETMTGPKGTGNNYTAPEVVPCLFILTLKAEHSSWTPMLPAI